MINGMKRLGIPLLVILSTAIIHEVITKFLSGDTVQLIVNLFLAIVLFCLGILFNEGKAEKAVLRKIVAVVFATLLLCMQMGWLHIPVVTNMFNMLGITGLFYSFLYIYCGYLYKS